MLRVDGRDLDGLLFEDISHGLLKRKEDVSGIVGWLHVHTAAV